MSVCRHAIDSRVQACSQAHLCLAPGACCGPAPPPSSRCSATPPIPREGRTGCSHLSPPADGALCAAMTPAFVLVRSLGLGGLMGTAWCPAGRIPGTGSWRPRWSVPCLRAGAHSTILICPLVKKKKIKSRILNSTAGSLCQVRDVLAPDARPRDIRGQELSAL